MLKRVILCLFSCLVIASILLVGCNSTTPSTTTAPPPVATTSQPVATTAAAPPSYVLRFSTTSTNNSPPGYVMQNFADKLTKATGGRVQVRVFYANSLFTSAEALRSIQSGVGDFCDFFTQSYSSQCALNNILLQPGIAWPDAMESTKIAHQLMKDFPQIEAEFENAKLLYTQFAGVPSELSTTKKLVKNTTDLKGMKLISQGTAQQLWLQSLGAAPVAVPYQDTFTSMNSGLVEGTLSSGGWQQGSGTVELLKYHTMFGQSTVHGQSWYPYLMALKTWQSFTPDIQKIVVDLEPWFNQERISQESVINDQVINQQKGLGHTFYTMPASEVKVWADAGAPVHAQYIKEYSTTQSTKPFQSLYDAMIKALAAYNK